MLITQMFYLLYPPRYFDHLQENSAPIVGCSGSALKSYQWDSLDPIGWLPAQLL